MKSRLSISSCQRVTFNNKGFIGRSIHTTASRRLAKLQLISANAKITAASRVFLTEKQIAATDLFFNFVLEVAFTSTHYRLTN